MPSFVRCVLHFRLISLGVRLMKNVFFAKFTRKSLKNFFLKLNSIAHIFDTACSLCWNVTITLNELCFPSIKNGISFKLIHVVLNDKCFHVCTRSHILYIVYKPTYILSIDAKWAREKISNCLKILFAHDDNNQQHECEKFTRMEFLLHSTNNHYHHHHLNEN